MTTLDNGEETDSCAEETSLSCEDQGNLARIVPTSSVNQSIVGTFNNIDYVMTMEELRKLYEHVMKLKKDGGDIISLNVEEINNKSQNLSKSTNIVDDENAQNQSLYLFHQSEMQQYLLHRYGSLLFIKEIKQRRESCKSNNFTLFLICARTNLDCQVVGTILANQFFGHAKALKQGLIELQQNNKMWKPKYLMIDPLEHCISVVEEVFQGLSFERS